MSGIPSWVDMHLIFVDTHHVRYVAERCGNSESHSLLVFERVDLNDVKFHFQKDGIGSEKFSDRYFMSVG